MPGLGLGLGLGLQRSGGGLAPPPDGFAYLVDPSDGAYLLDSDGAYLIVEEA